MNLIGRIGIEVIRHQCLSKNCMEGIAKRISPENLLFLLIKATYRSYCFETRNEENDPAIHSECILFCFLYNENYVLQWIQ